MRRRLLCFAVVAVLLLACGGDDDSGSEDAATGRRAAGATPEWPAPSDPLARARAAGLDLERREFLQVHRHAHLDVFFNGDEVTVPAGVGIDITDPGVQSGESADGAKSYGGIELCDRPCISTLHTHDTTGVLHTESQEREVNTLGQFFEEWDVRLDRDCVGEYCSPETDLAFYVDGHRFRGDPRTIELIDLREIAVVIGTPPDEIPDEGDFSQA